MSELKHIGIIGATSPIGKSIIELFVNNFFLTITYRSKDIIPHNYLKHPKIKWVYIDLMSPMPIKKNYFQNCHAIIWVAHVMQSQTREEEIKFNLLAIKSLLSILPYTSINKIVYISSGGSIYGNPFHVPITENHPLNPLSSYGKSKKAVEEILLDYHNQTNISVAILRPGNIYGPESITGRSKGVIASYIISTQSHKPFTIIGNKDVIRDFLYIDDLAQAVKFAIFSKKKKIIWNVGTETGHSVYYIINFLSDILNKKPSHIYYQKSQYSEILINILSNKRIMNESNWTVTTPLNTGLQKLVSIMIKDKKDKYHAT
ncbi:UDP-glucose-4-epimerase [Candidatus Magnetomorum sp. HK-1]|nr:UDP-glucose-4-epimerase [Candidatus Magnetomorum sp. HK-1]